ncbi:C2 family cysteine protease [Nocardiopsis baichengensis]|uniref:C2 family cysteine protease n=1 Tax=Nocardiopsis baichengensis TaxID=280240 RepID=UPI000344A0F7|nr:C2 family cysteine protease [Nocardiopsis baichengensis]
MLPRRDPGDRGASFVEYGAVVLLVAAIVVAVFSAGVPERVAGLFQTGLDRIGDPAGSADGTQPPEQDGDEPEQWNQAAPDQQGGSSGSDSGSEYDPAPPPGHPAGPPAPESRGADPDDADPDTVDAAVEDLDECLSRFSTEDEVPWMVSSCAWEVFQDLSHEEFGAVVRDMSEEDLYRLFETGPVPLEQDYFDWLEEVRRTADLDTLRKLDDSEAYFFVEPDFSDVGGDPAAGNSPSSLSYGELDDYSLFASGDDAVDWEHVDQGALGDCWLMATMGAMAVQDPGAIEDMIQENVNGTFTVTFPGQDPITVTPDLPLDAAGNPEFASSNEEPPVIWPAVLEKAYAQMNGGDYSRLENWHPGAAMTTFGGDATDYAPDDWVPPWEDVTMDGLADKFESGESITLSTPLDGEDSALVDDEEDTLVSAHVYFVSDVDREAGTVTVRNPWGSETEDIVLDIDQVNDNFAALHAADLG